MRTKSTTPAQPRKPIFVKGVYQKVNPADDRRRPHYSPELFQLARQRQEDFLTVICPALKRTARNRFHWMTRTDLEDAIQEVYAVAWMHFLRLLEVGYEPLDCIGCICKWAMTRIQKFVYAGGSEAKYDVHSRRAQVLHGFKLFTRSVWSDEI